MLPEEMIRSFERLHRLSVTVHDIAGSLGAGLAVERRGHRHALCSAVKSGGGQPVCSAFDVERLRSEAPHLPEGRVHVCPAGLVEWVVPVHSGGRLDFVVFAGPRAPGDLPGVTRSRRLLKPVHDLPTVDLDEARDLLEAVRQLSARLVDWARAHRAIATGGESRDTSRAKRLMSYLHLHHREELELAALARHLGLSPSRTSHEVRRLSGRSFNDLLRETRLATAVDLVLHTDLPIAEVAARSGFADHSHFFRAFRQRFGATPRRLRADRAGP